MSLTELVADISQWLTILDSITQQIWHRTVELEEVESFESRDQITPAEEIGQAYKKTARPEIPEWISSMHSEEAVPTTFSERKTRSMIVAHYDLVIQTNFEDLVKHISKSRNMLGIEQMELRKSQMRDAAVLGVDSGSNEGIDATPEFKGKAIERNPATKSQVDNGQETVFDEEPDWQRSRILDELDKGLEWCKSSCEHAAHQFLRGGDCSAEIDTIRERLIQVRRKIAVSMSSESKPEGFQRSTSPEAQATVVEKLTSNLNDLQNQSRIAKRLDRIWEFFEGRNGQQGSTSELEDSLRMLLGLGTRSFLTVCRWEAPKFMRQWYDKFRSHEPLGVLQKAAESQKTLLVFGNDPYFEVGTLEDFIDLSCGPSGRPILNAVVECLLSAISNELDHGPSSRSSQSIAPTYIASSALGTKPPCKLLLFEKYIILGIDLEDDMDESPSANGVEMSMSKVPLCISQALACRPPDAWGTPFKPATAPDKAYLSKTLKCMHRATHRKFQIFTTLPLELIEIKSSSCWTKLFSTNALIIETYITRSDEKGLSLSFDLMVYLAAIEAVAVVTNGYQVAKSDSESQVDEAVSNTRLVQNSDPNTRSDNSVGGIVLYGFFTALVPIREAPSSNTIVWHLEHKYYELELVDPFKLQSTAGDWLKVTDYEVLRQKRCVLGWWNEANIMLGTRQLKSEVRFSRPSSTKSRSLHLKGISAVGQIGLSTIVPLSFQSGANFQFVNNVQRFRRDKIYAIALMTMANDIGIVYDAESQRGWMVPMTSLLLHMSHIYYSQVIQGDISTDPIPYAEPSTDGATAALLALRGKGGTVVYRSEAGGEILLSSILACARGNISEANKTREKSKPGKLLATQYLNMVEEPTMGSEITVINMPASTNAWLGLVDRIGCVIVCAGLGEAIQSIVKGNKCIKGCDNLPCGKGYLGAHFWCLKKLLQRRGWDLTSLREQPVSINDDYTWTLSGKRFCSCTLNGEHPCRWDNGSVQLQQVKKRKLRFRTSQFERTTAVPPITGAAVFGI